ncbi:MAG: stage IV sporulation protein A, partial [Ruminococcaceae bacterium]|nr:stage IV sporulation protein A [Oscillospiraceae bacterium]
SYNIYQDIATRTNGDIYVGVVGPVRTGKSTFIKKFMDLLVIPNIENTYSQERAKDELPQSAAGKTIMTTEPKFIPNEAVEISLGSESKMKVRMIDCVGYIVEGAQGHLENDAPRMVSTPWSKDPIPFGDAAEIGTKKVITEHSTIGLVITTDGSVTDIEREDYVAAEERVIGELKEINKPFVVLLNTKYPEKPETEELRSYLENRYSVPVLAVNCATVSEEEINVIMRKILFQFPINEIRISMPKWIDVLVDDHWLKQGIENCILTSVANVYRIDSLHSLTHHLTEYEYIQSAEISEINLGTGTATLTLSMPEGLFYQIVKETSGFDIDGEDKLMALLAEMAQIKKEYDKISYALHQVQQKGYGIVTPTIDDLRLEEPEIVKQGSRFGVKLKASAPSIHMISANIETEVSPIVGTEKQSEELVHYLLEEFETDPKKIWESNIFGKSLHELVNEGLHNKLCRMPDEAQMKLQETLSKIINEGSGGLICIIL